MRQFLPLVVVSLLFVACSSGNTSTPVIHSSSSTASQESVIMYRPPEDGECKPVARFTKIKACPADTKAQFRDADSTDGFCLPKGCPVIKFQKKQ